MISKRILLAMIGWLCLVYHSKAQELRVLRVHQVQKQNSPPMDSTHRLISITLNIVNDTSIDLYYRTSTCNGILYVLEFDTSLASPYPTVSCNLSTYYSKRVVSNEQDTIAFQLLLKESLNDEVLTLSLPFYTDNKLAKQKYYGRVELKGI